MEDSKPRIDTARGVIIMEQNTEDNKAVADFLSQKNGTDYKREDVQVNERNRNNDVIGIRDRADGTQNQGKGQPRRTIYGRIFPQKRTQQNALVRITQIGRH